jgi:hypothetical protein
MLHKTGKAFFLFLVTMLAAVCAPGQPRYEIGLEGGVGQDQYKVRDPGGNLETRPSLGWLAGSTLLMSRHGKDVFYEAGLLVKKYVAGFALKQYPFNDPAPLNVTLLLPLRVGYKFNAYEWPAFIATFGVVPALKGSAADGSQGGFSGSNNNQSMEMQYTVRPINRHLYLLFQGGLSLEHQSRVWPGLKVFVSGNYYYQWLSTVTAMDIDYRINNESLQRGYVFGRGRFFNLAVGTRVSLK